MAAYCLDYLREASAYVRVMRDSHGEELNVPAGALVILAIGT